MLAASLYATPTVHAQTVVKTIPVGSLPIIIGADPATSTATGEIYAENYFGGTVSAIDGSSNTVATTITVGANPEGIGVNPVTHHIYVSNTVSNTVSVINGNTNTLNSTNTPIATCAQPDGIGIDQATNMVYVACFGAGALQVINGMTNMVVGSPIPLGLVQPVNVGVNSVTHMIYVADRSSNNVAVLDGTTNPPTLLGPLISAGTANGHFGLDVDPIRNLLYVSDSGFGAGNSLIVINGFTKTVTATIPVGSFPEGVGVDSLRNHIYVANMGSNTVSAVDGASNSVVATVPVAS